MAPARLRVLVPVREDPDLGSVLRILVSLAALRPLDPTLLRIVPPSADVAAAREASNPYLDRFRKRGFRARLMVGSGDPLREILICARTGFDWIALATRGRRGLRRALLGSLAEEILRRSPVPVLAFRPDVRPGDWRHTAVALDGTRGAESILPEAGRMAKACGTPLQLIHVQALTGVYKGGAYLERVRQKMEKTDVVCMPVLHRGSPARQILRHLRGQPVGLLCMATHGRTGVGRILLGSVAERVLRRAPCAVLIRRIAR